MASSRRCAEARLAYVNHLIQWLLEHRPEARPTLERWGYDQPQTVAPDATPAEHPFPVSNQEDGYALLGRIHGVVLVQDPNVAVRRPAVHAFFPNFRRQNNQLYHSLGH